MRKMNRWKRILALIILLLVAFTMIATSFSVFAAESSSYEVWMEDNADLLDDNEEAQLREVMAPITAYGAVGFYSTNDAGWQSTRELAGDVLHEHSGYGSGVVFVIDMDNRQIYIYSDGDIFKTLGNSKGDTITDNCYTYASDGDYYTCAKIAYEQIFTVLDGGHIAEPMRIASAAVLAVLIGMLICFWYVMATSTLHKAKESELIAGAACTFDNHFLGADLTHTTKTYDPPASSSGGGGGFSGGGGGGGGGHSGGGGGHSF